MSKLDVLKIDKCGKRTIQDAVTEEIPLTIYLNGAELLTLLCSPDSLRQLCAGFLYSSGLINAREEISSLTIDRQRWVADVRLHKKEIDSQLIFKRLYTSGCGRGALFYNALDFMHRKKITSNLRVSAEGIVRLMDSFQQRAVAFRQTGGVHSAALSDAQHILVFKEDIGRHNALDKVIGEALEQALVGRDLIVLSSGRISSEIVFKVKRMGAPFLVSRSAPTLQAVKLARQLNLTLIGFVRGERMNVYSATQRVI